MESFETGAERDERGTVNAHDNVLNTRIIECGTLQGPCCETQKQTNPCSVC